MSRGLAMTASRLIKVKKEVTNQQAKQKKGPRFKPIKCWSDALPFSFFFLFFSPGSSYSKRGGQTDNRSAGEDSGRKGSSGSSTTKVPASPLASSDRKKSGTPSTVRPNTHAADIFAFKPYQKHKGLYLRHRLVHTQIPKHAHK